MRKRKNRQNSRRKSRWWQKLIRILAALLGTLVGGLALLILYLTLAEYKPADREAVGVVRTAPGNQTGAPGAEAGTPTDGSGAAAGSPAGAPMPVQAGASLSLVTWNIGYGGLGHNADFFLDGGSSVRATDRAGVEQNLSGINETLSALAPDLVCLQEVDRHSMRSYGIDQLAAIQSGFGASAAYDVSFAPNYRVPFIPYPIPPIGYVDAGIVTMSRRAVGAAERIQLPVPFSWPARLANLKRCLLVNRIPVTDARGEPSGRELVLINLHLEAYDSGAGKAEQTAFLRTVMQAESAKGNYVIAAGDFNQCFSNVDSSAYPQQADLWQPGQIDVSEFGPDWRFFMDHTHPTCRSLDRPYLGADPDAFQYYLIDGLIVSANIGVESVETVRAGFVNSDHNPVILRFELRPEP